MTWPKIWDSRFYYHYLIDLINDQVTISARKLLTTITFMGTLTGVANANKYVYVWSYVEDKH